MHLQESPGKNRGGITQILSTHREEVDKIFPGGIRCLMRATSDTTSLDQTLSPYEQCRGDMDDVDFYINAFQGVDTVLHIAGVRLSRYVVDAAVVCRVRRLILVHTTGIYSKYKAAGEEYRHIDAYVERKCREHNILLTILRPTMIYGNTSDENVVVFLKMVDRFPIMPVVSGARFKLQPVHYMDLAEAYYAVLTNEEATANRNFVLSGGEEIYLRDMLSVMGEKLGKKVKFISCPFPIAYTGAWILYVVTMGRKDFREKVQRLVEPRCYSHQEAADAFGYSPRRFREGIVAEIEEYKNGR